MEVFTSIAMIGLLCVIGVGGYIIYRLISRNSDLKINNLNLSIDNKELDVKAKQHFEDLIEVEKQYREVVGKLDKTVHQKKSSEVRLGKIGENLAPFTDGWPWEPNDFRFLGSPIDGIQFTEDRIYLVEIKTGKARLSKKQMLCRDLVKEGKISFVSYRIDAEGHSIIEVPALSE